MNINIGKIDILLENVSEQDTMRIKKVIDTLFSNDIFNTRNGWVKLNFDNNKNLSSIEKNSMIWRSNYLLKNAEHSIISRVT